MTTRVFISFNEGRSRYAEVRELLTHVGCQEGLKGPEHLLCGLYGGEFDSEDPRLHRLRAVLQASGIRWSERCERTYSVADLQQAPLLRLMPTRKPIDGGEPEYGTTYNVETGCPSCGTGAQQVSSLRVPLNALPSKGTIGQTHRGHVLTNTRLAEAFRSAKLSGLELRQAQSRRECNLLPWWQLIAAYTMPRMGPDTKGIVRDTISECACPVCERDMYAETMAEPTSIVYDSRLIPRDLPDFAHTWECFGRSILKADPKHGLAQGFAQPLVLVSQKVYNLLRTLKIKDAGFEPIRIA